MGPGPTHETRVAAVSHALLFLTGVCGMHVIGGCEVDDASVMVGAQYVHHDTVATAGVAGHM
jgi:hypothetical protein